MFGANLIAKLLELRLSLAELQPNLPRDFHEKLMRPFGVQGGAIEIKVGKGEWLQLIEGMIEESTTRRPSTPITRVCGSTTAKGSAGDPIRHEQEGW